jgi:hypothetical protein
MHFQAQNLSRFAFDRDFEWPAADLAIRREPLAGGARVNRQVKALAAIGALNGFAGFHVS